MILGHTFYFALPFLDNPIWALDTIQNSLSMEAVKQGLFSVDSFFFLSGLLVSYLFLMKRNEVKNASSLVFWMKIIGHRQGLVLLTTLLTPGHRFLRLLPPYLALILLLEPLLFYTCSGTVLHSHWSGPPEILCSDWLTSANANIRHFYNGHG